MRMKTRAASIVVLLGLVVALGGLCYADHSYPRVGNLFEADAQPEYAPALSKWDIVGLTVSVQDLMPELLVNLRTLNPEIKIVAYVPAGLIWAIEDTTSPTLADYWSKIHQADWWLYDTSGNRIGDESYLWFLNLSTRCRPDESGEILAQWLARYIAHQMMAGGLWNGVFLDGLDEDIRWLYNTPRFFRQLPAAVDCDRDGVADDPDSLYLWWKSGVEVLLSTLRTEAGASCIILPNGNNTMFQYANGTIRENFPRSPDDWEANMYSIYGYITGCQRFLHEPLNASMMLCYWKYDNLGLYRDPSSGSFEQFMRFTLASALLGDGYYFMDGGVGGSLWWQDYYDLDLGDPIAPAYLDTIQSQVGGAMCPVWRREFENASVICNPWQQYVVLEDGTWMLPEDGLIRTHRLPGPLGITLNQQASEREFDQRQRAVQFEIVISNPSANAAQSYAWAEVSDRGRVVASGMPFQTLVGACETDTVKMGLRVPSSLTLGTYCLRVSVGGPDYLPVGADTLYLTKVIDFEKGSKVVSDSNSKANANVEESNLVIYPQPMVLSSNMTLTLEANQLTSLEGFCSVKIYDATGRLVRTVYEGKLEEGLDLGIGQNARGGVPEVPGVYFLHVETREKTFTRKIVLLK
ncbi:MAG: putative glycoside hydrolase [Candidatus Eisenbacteria bacterium]